MTVTIIHHGGCPDGFGAAWWLSGQIRLSAAQMDDIPPEIERIAATYGDPPPLAACEGKFVFIVDFSYPAADLDDIANVAQRVVMLDHHKTAIDHVKGSSYASYSCVQDMRDDEWASGGILPDRVAVLDMTRSGIGIVSDYCEAHGGHPVPDWMLMIEDRDLWTWRYGDLTKNVFAAVTSRPYTDEAWSEINQLGVEALRDEGIIINRYRDQLIEQVSASSFPLDLQDAGGGYIQVPCASSPYAIGSDVAGLLAESNPDGVGAYVILHEDDVQVGLRSRNDGPDVSKIAERYGGGGHRGASGFRLRWDDLGLMVGVR